MATRRQRKLEKKRRKEEQQRIKHRNRPVSAASLAYHGDRYKTDEFVPIFASTETGIIEAFAISDRRLTDRSVEQALVKMIVGMRQDTLQPLNGEALSSEEATSFEGKAGDEQELIIWRVSSHWQDLFENKPAPARDTLIGVLRTILGSIEVWRSPGPTSRGYLHYIDGFLGKAGISVESYPVDEEPDEEDDQQELLELGRDWCYDGDEEARLVFENLVQHLIHSGQAETVVDVCQQLIGETGNSPVMASLMDYSLQAQRRLLAD